MLRYSFRYYINLIIQKYIGLYKFAIPQSGYTNALYYIYVYYICTSFLLGLRITGISDCC